MLEYNLQLFGGRGASAGGDLGGGGGEDVDYDDKGDVMSVKDLGFRNNVMQTIKDFYDNYPGLNNVVENEAIVVIKNKPNVMAFWEEGANKFAFNERYTNTQKLQNAYDRNVESGYHPPRGNKTAEQAVTAHEFGHAITTVARIKNNMGFDEISKKIITNVVRDNKIKNVKQFANRISVYAKKNNAECIAEAVADVYCNGRNAKNESKLVYKELKKWL